VGLNLFWRTFFLLGLLLVGCMLAWLQTLRALEFEPRTLHTAQQIASMVNLSRAALVHADAIARVSLIKTMADQEGVRILPREPGDHFELLDSSDLGLRLTEALTERLGPGTVVARSVNGEEGLWVGFTINDDPNWLLMDRSRFSPAGGKTWLVWLATATILSLVGAAAIAGLINRPLKQLSNAANRVREGDFAASHLDEEAVTSEIREVNIGFNRMAQKLAKLEQDRAVMIAGISHDLRTPLTSISGNADVLLDQGSTGTAVLDDQTRRGMLLSIRSDAQWLNATVENLLAITKLEGGGMHLATTLELMDDIVEEALRHVSPAVREHDLKVVACDEPALVNVDARLMVQLVVNLVNNAITYTPAGSHIVISIGVDDGHVTCSVADDGPGIAPEDRERIFESFYTANHGLADSHRSVGLGLSLCRSIALAHGGSIEVAAADPQGSVFTIELPVADVSFDKE